MRRFLLAVACDDSSTPFREVALKALASGTYPEISLRKTRDKSDETRRDLCNDIYPAPKWLETHVFPYVGRTNAARMAGADLLAVLRDSGMGHLRAYSSRALHLQPRVEIGASPSGSAGMSPLISSDCWFRRRPSRSLPSAHILGTIISNNEIIRPRAINRQALAISTVARRAADWMDAAHFVLLGFFI